MCGDALGTWIYGLFFNGQISGTKRERVRDGFDWTLKLKQFTTVALLYTAHYSTAEYEREAIYSNGVLWLYVEI